MVRQTRVTTQGLRGEIAAMASARSGSVGPLALFAAGRRSAVRVEVPQFLRLAILARADSVLLVHTHLDDLPPTPQDESVTRRLVAACALVGLSLSAHLVVGPTLHWDCLSRSGTAPIPTLPA